MACISRSKEKEKYAHRKCLPWLKRKKDGKKNVCLGKKEDGDF
jgi:hypothetical protein